MSCLTSLRLSLLTCVKWTVVRAGLANASSFCSNFWIAVFIQCMSIHSAYGISLLFLLFGSFFCEIRKEKLSGEEQEIALWAGCAVLMTPTVTFGLSLRGGGQGAVRVSRAGAESCAQCCVCWGPAGLPRSPLPLSPLPDSLCVGPLLRQESQGWQGIILHQVRHSFIFSRLFFKINTLM